MSEITMCREGYQVNQEQCEHAGLMLERGFKQWQTTDKQYNQQKKKFYDRLTQIPASKLYIKAYRHWLNFLLEDTATRKFWSGKVDGRLYLGLGEASPLESAVTLHHTYGVPFISGSAIKGVLHHAMVEAAIDPKVIETLFGREPDPGNKQDIGDAGYIIFHDAWWIPQKENPLVKEVITVHHPEYYRTLGKQPATDFDSPNPNPQIAIKGSFLFSIEGETRWANYTIALLKDTLKNKGIGAKTASGYGYFIEDENTSLTIERDIKAIKQEAYEENIEHASSKEKIDLMVERLALKDLPKKLGKERNKTKKEIDKIDPQAWQNYIEQIQNKFKTEIIGWKDSKNANERKAYKTIIEVETHT